jgi:hypothetical protein
LDSGPESTFAGHLTEIGHLGPRIEGSVGEAAAIAYITKALEQRGLRPRVQRLSGLADGHSWSRSITVSFPGLRNDLLAFIIPLGSHVDGPDGEGNAGIALALTEAIRLADAIKGGRSLPVGVGFTFLGGERRGPYEEGASAGPGSRWWIDSLDEQRPTAAIYLSLDFTPGIIGLRNAGPGILSPFWLFERTRLALAASGFTYRLFPNRMQGYRLGLLERPGPLVPYLAAGIPAIELRAEMQGTGPATNPEGPFSAFVDSILASSSDGFSGTWDRDYSSFQVGDFSFVVREGPYIIFLLCFVAAFSAFILLLTVLRRSELPRMFKKAPRRLAFLLLLSGIAALSFVATQGCTNLEKAIIGSSNSWHLAPSLFAAGRLGVLLSLFLALVSFSVSRGLLTSDPWFYEVMALVILGIDVILFAIISLPLSLYFCWGFVMTLVSVLVRKALASLVALVLLYLPLGLLAFEMIATPEASAITSFISPTSGQAILLALIITPFAALTASPLLFFAPKGERMRRRASLIFFLLAIVMEGGLLADASARAGTTPIIATEVFDQDRASFNLGLQSDARLGELVLKRRSMPIAFSTRGDHASFTGEDDRVRIRVTETDKPFLDRVTRHIRLDFDLPPYSIELRADADRTLTTYDCSLPYRVALDGRSISVFCGPGQPAPLEFELTTSPDFEARLFVSCRYLGSLEAYEGMSQRPVRAGDQYLLASFRIGRAVP